MARITVEDGLKQIPNRFALVHAAVKRTRQLRKGSKALVEADNRDIVVALREIAAGEVEVEEESKKLLDDLSSPES